MTPRQRTRATLVSKPDLVSTTLIYPMTLTTDNATILGGLTITSNVSAPLGQGEFQVKDSSGNIKQYIGTTGGLTAITRDIRAYNSAGTAYVALSGRRNPACIEFPDGTSAQGSKLWSGTGAPSSTTIGGAAATGDYYLRRADPVAATLVAASHTAAGTTQATLAVGSGTLSTSNTTKDLDGVPQAGDLLVFVAMNGVSSVTASVGSDSGITDTSADGGFTANDGTRYVHVFARVVQSGDISSSQIVSTASANNAGTGRRLVAYVFRHPAGFATTGSLHGCPLVGSASDTAASATATLTASAASTYASVEFAMNYASATTGCTYLFDGGNSSVIANEGGGTVAASWCARPGRGTNTSGATGSTTGLTASVAMTTMTTTRVAALGVWQAAGSAVNATDPFLYVCTSAGTPGTWAQVI